MVRSPNKKPPFSKRFAKYLPKRDPVHQVDVFIVDDEPIIIETISHYLSMAGFTNLHGFCKSGEALEMLRYVRPGIILTDINMPDVSGSFLTKMVRTFKHLANVPILVITADTSAETEKMVMCLGANQFIRKPIDGKELVTQVTQALELREKESRQEIAKLADKKKRKFESMNHTRNQEHQLRQLTRGR